MIDYNPIIHKIKHFKEMFDKRTYSNFVGIVKGIIFLKKWSQPDLADFGDKTLRQMQYFFSKAKWCHKKLNEYRLRFLRNKPNFNDRTSDYVVADGSAVKKDKDSKFRGMTDSVFSNKLKQVVNGFYILGASVITNEGLKYILDFKLYFKSKFKNEMEAWQQFAKDLVKKTRAWIFILDSGFKGPHFCKYIHNDLNRHFLVRISKDQLILTKDKEYQKIQKKKSNRGRKKKYPEYSEHKISNLLKEENCININHGKLWIFNNVLLKSWLGEFETHVQVIVIHKKGFKNPMVLVTSVNYNGEFSAENACELLETYYKRWSIEMLFKEVKSWLSLESFRLQTEESIYKFLHMIIFCHTLLTILHDTVCSNSTIKLYIEKSLRKGRNIKNNLTVIGLKLFLESLKIKNSISLLFDLLHCNEKKLLGNARIL